MQRKTSQHNKSKVISNRNNTYDFSDCLIDQKDATLGIFIVKFPNLEPR